MRKNVRRHEYGGWWRKLQTAGWSITFVSILVLSWRSYMWLGGQLPGYLGDHHLAVGILSSEIFLHAERIRKIVTSWDEQSIVDRVMSSVRRYQKKVVHTTAWIKTESTEGEWMIIRTPSWNVWRVCLGWKALVMKISGAEMNDETKKIRSGITG